MKGEIKMKKANKVKANKAKEVYGVEYTTIEEARECVLHEHYLMYKKLGGTEDEETYRNIATMFHYYTIFILIRGVISVSMAAACKLPASITAQVEVPTCVGDDLAFRSPNPSSPSAFIPHVHSVSSSLSAMAQLFPQVTLLQVFNDPI